MKILLKELYNLTRKKEREPLIQAIAQKAEQDESLKCILKAIIEPYDSFYVSKGGLWTKTDLDRWLQDPLDYGYDFKPTPETCNLLEGLKTRAISGDDAVNKVSNYLNTTKDLSLLFAIHKDLRVGLGLKTAAKYMPFLEVWDMQKGLLYKGIGLTYPLYAELKMNGNRVAIYKQNGTVHFRTYNGSRLKATGLLKGINIPEGAVVDGEIIWNEGKSHADMLEVNRRMTSALATKSELEVPSQMRLSLWDIYPYENLIKRKTPDLDYKARKEILGRFVDKEYLTPYVIVQNEEELMSLFNKVIKNGYEGLMLKPLSGELTFKKDGTWYKMKDLHHNDPADLMVVSYRPHETKPDQIGALFLAGKVGDKLIQVWVGSGLNDSDRARPFDDYIGKTFEVGYAEITYNTSGTYSLQFPHFIKPNPSVSLIDLHRHDK